MTVNTTCSLLLLLVFSLFLAAGKGQTVVAEYDLSGTYNANALLNGPTFGPTSSAYGSAGVMGYLGVTPVNKTGWIFSDWPTSSTDRDPNKYISWSYSPLRAVGTEEIQVTLGVFSDVSGPTQWDLLVSSDPEFNTIDSSLSFMLPSNASTIRTVRPIPYVNSFKAIYFRLHGYAAGVNAARTGGLEYVNYGNTLPPAPGIQIESRLVARVCPCSSLINCPNPIVSNYTWKIFGFECDGLQDPCSGLYQDSFKVEIVDNRLFNVSKCGTPDWSAQPCGVCNDFGLYVSCEETCGAPDSSSSGNRVMPSFSKYLFDERKEE